MIPEVTPQKTQQHEHDRAEPNETPQSKAPEAMHLDRPSARWSSHRRRDAWFLLVVLLLGMGAVLVLSNVSALSQKRGNGSAPAILSTSTTSATPASPANVFVRTAQTRLYPFRQSNVGLMQLAVDAQGNVWVGEMYANRLARLDSQTGVVTTWQPPDGKNGLMSTAIDAQGKVWFVEQGANYIGRFDPTRQTFHIFSLGAANGHPLGPQDLQFDVSGRLWFTAAGGGQIGRLDPTTGAIQTWPVPAPRVGIASFPFSLTVTPDGQIWFGDLTGGAVGHLDSVTGHVTLYRLADPQAQVFSMGHDGSGRIWFTEIVPGRLGMIDSATGKVTELSLPTVAGHPATLYSLVVAQNGDIWFVNNGADALVRYSPQDTSYTFFQLSLLSSAPYGLTLDSAGRLWFTASGSSANTVGEMKP